MQFIITEPTKYKHVYSNRDKATFRRLYNIILPQYKKDLSRVCSINKLNKLDNENRVFDLLCSNVPAIDFRMFNKNYIISVFNYILNYE